jgi:hypothetical protein
MQGGYFHRNLPGVPATAAGNSSSPGVLLVSALIKPATGSTPREVYIVQCDERDENISRVVSTIAKWACDPELSLAIEDAHAMVNRIDEMRCSGK